MKAMINLLKPIKIFTDKLQASNSATISLVYPGLNNLITFLHTSKVRFGLLMLKFLIFFRQMLTNI